MRRGGYRYPIYWHYIEAEGSNILVALRLQMKAVKVRYRHSVVNLYGIFSCSYLRLGLVRFQPPKAQEIRDMEEVRAIQRTHQQELLRMREHKARIDTEREKEIERRLEGEYDEIELSLIRFKSFLKVAENDATRGEYQKAIKDFKCGHGHQTRLLTT